MIFENILLQLEWLIIWNSLPVVVVNADSIDIFKSKLDKYLNRQAIKYDYQAALMDSETDLSTVIKSN